MKVANLLLSGLAVAAMAFMATGCNENTVDPDPNPGGAPTPASNVQASSIGASQVALSWTASTDTGTITYLVSWAPTTGGVASDSSSATVTSGTTYTATGLATNKTYMFYVRASRSGLHSTAATVTWAGAVRYNTEQGSSTTIRMYERASSSGSGLTLDPPTGPKNVSVGTSNTTPNSVQLAVYTTDGDPDNFEIGPAYAFTEYRNANKFDQRVFVSTLSYPSTSLSTWYSTSDIQSQIPNDGNIRAFKLPVAQATNGQGFYVRTGDAGNYHYARVFVKNIGGRLMQGSAPNRYVELEVSYQTNANVAYAKTNSYLTPGNIESKVYHPLQPGQSAGVGR